MRILRLNMADRTYCLEEVPESLRNLGGRGVTSSIVQAEVPAINGQLSAMPGLQPDLGHLLQDGDRIGLFDLRSIWPFQYRHGAAMIPEMARAIHGPRGIRHSYQQNPRGDATTVPGD